MKKRTNLLFVPAVILALIVGFMIGISVEYPRADKDGVSGTIGKVKNYRNTKATEADIELKDALLADTVLLKSVRKYMTYHYVRSVKFGESIDFAVREALANEAFKNQSASHIAALDDYGKLLSTARKSLLMTVKICQSAGEVSPALLRQSIMEANNLIVQINYGNKTVLRFISKLDAFIEENGTGAYPELNRAHDLLTLNEVGSSLLTKDKALMKFFDKKKLYNKDLKSPRTDMNKIVMQDIETLSWFLGDAPGISDAEKLGAWDQEKLGLLDVDNLRGIGALDAEQLAVVEIEDSEKLGRIFDSAVLGTIIADAENLGFLDGENLGLGFYDAEKLGESLWDSEKLGTFLDNEILGVPGYWDYNENP